MDRQQTWTILEAYFWKFIRLDFTRDGYLVDLVEWLVCVVRLGAWVRGENLRWCCLLSYSGGWCSSTLHCPWLNFVVPVDGTSKDNSIFNWRNIQLDSKKTMMIWMNVGVMETVPNQSRYSAGNVLMIVCSIEDSIIPWSWVPKILRLNILIYFYSELNTKLLKSPIQMYMTFTESI